MDEQVLKGKVPSFAPPSYDGVVDVEPNSYNSYTSYCYNNNDDVGENDITNMYNDKDNSNVESNFISNTINETPDLDMPSNTFKEISSAKKRKYHVINGISVFLLILMIIFLSISITSNEWVKTLTPNGTDLSFGLSKICVGDTDRLNNFGTDCPGFIESIEANSCVDIGYKTEIDIVHNNTANRAFTFNYIYSFIVFALLCTAVVVFDTDNKVPLKNDYDEYGDMGMVASWRLELYSTEQLGLTVRLLCSGDQEDMNHYFQDISACNKYGGSCRNTFYPKNSTRESILKDYPHEMEYGVVLAVSYYI
eukprot:Pgem_evm1s5576